MNHRKATRFVTLLLMVLISLIGWRSLSQSQSQGQSQTHPEWQEQTRQQQSVREEKLPLWSSTRTLTSRENAEAHWRKHRHEFPEYCSAQEYIDGAHRFLRGPPAGTETKHRPNGDTLYYHAASNTFAVQARNGAPRTMFRPTQRQRYWQRQ